MPHFIWTQNSEPRRVRRKRLKRRRCLRCTRYTSCLPHCSVHRAAVEHLRIGPSPIAGLGLFAVGEGVVFRKGERIARYAGEQYDGAEIEALYPNNQVGPYTMVSSTPDLYLDGATLRTPAAMANASEEPNAVFLSAPRFPLLVAAKDIAGGEEITVDYGPMYFAADTVHLPHKTL